MASKDEIIGRNIQLFRQAAAITQDELAAKMTERGWKWSQSTVWSVEKGDRPVRLAETIDLAAILHEEVQNFAKPPETYEYFSRELDWERAEGVLIDRMVAMEAATAKLAAAADSLDRAEGAGHAERVTGYVNLRGTIIGRSRADLSRHLWSLVPARRHLVALELPSEERDGSFVRTFITADEGLPTYGSEALPADQLERENWTVNHEIPDHAFDRFTELIFGS